MDGGARPSTGGRADDGLTARLMATFAAEAEERVQAMKRDVLLLGGSADARAESALLEALVREAHSLKGAAGAVGSEHVETIAHRLEDLFGQPRSSERIADPAVGDVILSVLDAAGALVREATAGDHAGIDLDAIATMLDDLERGMAETPSEESSVLVPAAKLAALLAGLEELAAANAAAEQRIRELREMADELAELVHAPSATGAGRVDAPPESRARPAVVLLAENSETTLALQTHLLEHAGYQVRAAGDGDDAWSLLQEDGDIDAVISDILMPGIDGFELTARIRADPALRHLPVILITSTDKPAHRERCVEVGANAYVVKWSAEYDELVKAVERLT